MVERNFQRTRLAPSPTGRLHLGHARTFLITWWMARQSGAQVLMRMEDLDAGRAKPEAVAQAYEDLRWLGMEWRDQEVVQSARMGEYERSLNLLRSKGLAYACTCRRADIAAAVAGSAGAPHDGEDVRYPGTCQKLGEDGLRSVGLRAWRKEGAGEKEACWRFRVPEGVVRFVDGLMGAVQVDVGQEVGDFPVTRFDGTPAYQLAVVTDDAAMGMDAVIRGADLLSSTPRQLLLYQALGHTPPRFWHVPLVIGPDGKRLAKRHGESRIAQFRQMGVSPEKVVGWAAWRSGQMERPQEISAAEMVGRFDLAKLPREAVVLTNEDLDWLRP